LKIIKSIKGIEISNSSPFVLFGGVNVIESPDFVLKSCEKLLGLTQKLGIPLIFKASFDKANRSSIKSFRGPGLQKGKEVFREVKQAFSVPIITDVHEKGQAEVLADVVDIIQLPAFLARQTDLVEDIAKSARVVNVKKPQFMSPSQVGNVIDKFEEFGCSEIIICERGTCFGYDNLVVDMLGFEVMKKVTNGSPVIFDVTHSLQQRNALASTSGGRGEQTFELARAGLACKIAGLFIETHLNPENALCDGPSALPMINLEEFLLQVKAIDDLVKSFKDPNIN
jgi:2-dehydro-3-deoxyphosphooctonate aldolase (KDO 8-P synthase)